MSKQVLVSHAVYHIDKPVGLAVQIRLVNLLDISGKHHLRTFSRTGNDGLYLIRRQVLRLVDDALHFAQAAATYKCQSLNDQLFTFLHIFYTLHFSRVGSKLAFYHVQVVE